MVGGQSTRTCLEPCWEKIALCGGIRRVFDFEGDSMANHGMQCFVSCHTRWPGRLFRPLTKIIMKTRSVLRNLWWLCVCAGLGRAADIPIVSPEVHPDHQVTFRVLAPKASDVRLWGDWMAPNSPEPMPKDDRGVWSLTIPSIEPGLSIYTVTIDGVTTPDPINPRVKLRARTSASLVSVPGNSPEIWEARDVPHGQLTVHWSKSAILGDTRFFVVYTPPGYMASASRRYPILYLLHGSNDTPLGWTDVGKANFILDNLIAESQAKPMVIVMPWGHAVPFDGPQTNNNALFEQYLLQEVMPSVERDYRVKTDRAHRAIVGLSMGGGQALQIGLGHLDRFGSLGAFSAAVPSQFEERFKAVLQAPDSTNRKLKLLWIGCGRQDGAFDSNQSLSALLNRHSIHHVFAAENGRHNFAFWRRQLVEVAPLLFKGE